MLSDNEVRAMGFASCGNNVQISEMARFYGAERIKIGNDVRIDDFCVLSAGEGGIEIGNYVHLAVFCTLIGAATIRLGDFSNLSSRVSIYSSNDDYTGTALTNPTVPDNFKNVLHAPVCLEKHVIIGSGSVVLPGVTLEEGVAIGALSLVKKSCGSYGIYSGNPIKRIRERKRDLLLQEDLLMRQICTG